MHGHTDIIANRMQGRAPRFVFVNDYPCKTDWFERGEQATVCTHGDSVNSLDLRFLVGLRVSVSATTESRAMALFERVKAAGAAAVAAVHVLPNCSPSAQRGWCQVFTKETQHA
jgi:hypothetical protein